MFLLSSFVGRVLSLSLAFHHARVSLTLSDDLPFSESDRKSLTVGLSAGVWTLRLSDWLPI